MDIHVLRTHERNEMGNAYIVSNTCDVQVAKMQ